MVGMPRLTFALGMTGDGRIVHAGPTPVPLLVGAVVTAISPIFSIVFSSFSLFSFISFEKMKKKKREEEEQIEIV